MYVRSLGRPSASGTTPHWNCKFFHDPAPSSLKLVSLPSTEGQTARVTPAVILRQSENQIAASATLHTTPVSGGLPGSAVQV